jgi:hypothetical protein
MKGRNQEDLPTSSVAPGISTPTENEPMLILLLLLPVIPDAALSSGACSAVTPGFVPCKFAHNPHRFRASSTTTNDERNMEPELSYLPCELRAQVTPATSNWKFAARPSANLSVRVGAFFSGNRISEGVPSEVGI